MLKLSFVLSFLLLFTNYLLSQTGEISGTIYGADDNLPLPGVTIAVEGVSGLGTVSDFDGNFKISGVHDTAFLVLTFVGYETLKIKAKENLSKISLNPYIQTIEEVVITVPYGSQKRETFTGSVGILQAKQLDKLPISSFEKSFQGNIAGVQTTSASGQPGSGTQIRIRGIGSISAGSEPLYVLDGIPINAQQLSRTSSATDQAATAEVSDVNILSGLNPSDIESITILKDAAATSLYGSRASNGVIMITTKSGTGGKTKYAFNTTHGFSKIAQNSFRTLTASEFLELRQEALLNAGYTIDEVTQLNGNATVATNWFDEVYDYGYYSNYELSASGGTDKTNFYISGMYRNEEGIVINTGLEKYSGRLNITHKASDKLNFGAKVSITHTNQLLTPGSSLLTDPVVGAYILPPNMSLRNTDGSYNYSYNSQIAYNVIGISEADSHYNATNRVLANVQMQYKIIKDLQFKTIFNYDNVNLQENGYISPLTPDGSIVNGRAWQLNIDQNILSSSNTLNYSKEFHKKHTIQALIGYEVQTSNKQITDINASQFASNQIQSLGTATSFDVPNAYNPKSNMQSFISSLQYNFNNSFYLSGSLRRDGSSKFSTGGKWGNFWSVGAAWRITETKFMQNISNINSLKLRTSIGTSGNEDFPDYMAYSLYGFGYNYNQDKEFT
ncbi:MAG: SusC/RagA family TonB-linked outer membrane protein [Bacteroidales bacterium]|nr:SusC/RagA family TonB-linked outer membrane protein [Bacteroidales bacterium]